VGLTRLLEAGPLNQQHISPSQPNTTTTTPISSASPYDMPDGSAGRLPRVSRVGTELAHDAQQHVTRRPPFGFQSAPQRPAQFSLQARLHTHTLLITMMEREAVPYMSAEPPFCHAVAPTGAIFLWSGVEGVGGRARRGRRRPRYRAFACGVRWGWVRLMLRMDQNSGKNPKQAWARSPDMSP